MSNMSGEIEQARWDAFALVRKLGSVNAAAQYSGLSFNTIKRVINQEGKIYSHVRKALRAAVERLEMEGEPGTVEEPEVVEKEPNGLGTLHEAQNLYDLLEDAERRALECSRTALPLTSPGFVLLSRKIANLRDLYLAPFARRKREGE